MNQASVRIERPAPYNCLNIGESVRFFHGDALFVTPSNNSYFISTIWMSQLDSVTQLFDYSVLAVRKGYARIALALMCHRGWAFDICYQRA